MKPASDENEYKCCICKAPIPHPGICDKCVAKQKAEEERARNKLQTVSTIPLAFRWAVFSEQVLYARVRDREAIRKADGVVAKLASGEVSSVVFLGPSGVGKTSLACAVLQASKAYRVGATARFQSAIELASACRATAFGRESEVSERSKSASLLVLDDVGSEPALGADAIREVVHYRSDHGKPTIYTTWQTSKDLSFRYGDGTTRRIMELSTQISMVKHQYPELFTGPPDLKWKREPSLRFLTGFGCLIR